MKSLKQDKGVAGLTVLLSLVTVLFVIGLLVFIFAIMGGEFMDSTTLTASESNTVTQNNIHFNSSTGALLTTCNSANEGLLSSITYVVNASDNTTYSSGNYTSGDCYINATATNSYNNTLVNVTYVYTSAGSSWDVINDTTSSISTVTDWYNIFIVIGAMVVLILLIVIIVNAIRGSGLMMGGGGSNGNVGSA